MLSGIIKKNVSGYCLFQNFELICNEIFGLHQKFEQTKDELWVDSRFGYLVYKDIYDHFELAV